MTRYYCPCCGQPSTQVYRCSECGHDLAGTGSTAGREDLG